MSDLLKFEFYKMQKTKAFWGCLIACVGVAAISVLLFWGILSFVTGDLLSAAGGFAEDLMFLKEMNLLDYGVIAVSGVQFISIITCVIITSMVAKDFEIGTLRNVAAKSYSRTSIYLSKQIMAWFVEILYMAVFVVVCMAIAALLFRGPILAGTAVKFIKVMVMEVLMYMATATIYVMMTFLIRNGGGAVAANIGIILLISIVMTGLDFILSGGQGVFFRSLWIFSAIEQSADLDITTITMIKDVVISLIISAVSLGIGISVFNKRDMK